MLQIDTIHTNDARTPGAISSDASQSRRSFGAMLILLAAVTGCSDDPVSLGSTVAVDRSALSAYAAVWEGYAEAHTFPSGSDRVVLVLDEEGNGSFGDAAPRPMPTDADDPFPDLAIAEYDALIEELYHEGLSYEITQALVEQERLRARTGPRKVYGAAACALQAPVAVIDPFDRPYSCVPYPSTSSRDGQCFSANFAQDGTISAEIEVDCRKLAFCYSFCGCTASECFPLNPGEPILIDGALDEDGTKLVGTLDSFTVRLTRQP
jgi:hypothetical protein